MIVLGLDLGKTGNPSALAAVEPVWLQKGLDLDHQPIFRLEKHVRHLQRFPLGTRYMDIVDRVIQFTRSPQLTKGYYLVIDGTGVGVPVVEQFQHSLNHVIPVTITSGVNESFDPESGYWRVCKHNLVSAVVVGLEHHDLRFAPDLPEREAVVKELMNFRMRINSIGNDTYEAWKEREHDDLVLALCLACWGIARTRSRPQAAQRMPIRHPLQAPNLRGII